MTFLGLHKYKNTVIFIGQNKFINENNFSSASKIRFIEKLFTRIIDANKEIKR